MKPLFGGSTPAVTPVPAPEPLPPPPERTAAETEGLADQQRVRFAGRKGRASSLLTGGQGTETGGTASRFLGSSGGF